MTTRDTDAEPPLTADVPYRRLRGRYHEHVFQGQKLRHAHEDGDQAHGYYGHPEDPDPDRGCPL
jgi:hypothetical protein